MSILRQGFIQRHGWDALNPPDPTPAHEASFTLSQQEESSPIPQTAAQLANTGSEAFASSHTLSNAAFMPLGVSSPNADPSLRAQGLAAYVTQDIDPNSALFTKQTFGDTPIYLNDHTTNSNVGRALTSAAGYTGDPALYLREIGSRIGLTFPSDFANDNQLYAHIGAQFAQRERSTAQKQQTAKQTKTFTPQEQERLAQALVDAANSKKLRPYQSSLIQRAGIKQSSIRKVQHLLREGKLPGINANKNWFQRTFNSRFNEFDIEEMADFIGDDAAARFIVLELARRNGQLHEKIHQHNLQKDNLSYIAEIRKRVEDEFKETIADTVKPVGKMFWDKRAAIVDSAAALIKTALIKGDLKDAADALSFTDEATTRRRNAFRHDFTNAYNAGMQEQQDAAINGTDAHWMLSVDKYLSRAASMAGETLPYFTSPGAALAINRYIGKETEQAASNALKDDALFTASNWELYGTPAAKGAIFGGSIAATGAIAGAAAKTLANSTAIGKLAANRLAATPISRYASRFAEGTIAEAGEELTNALGQEALELSGLVADRQKQENWSQFVDSMASPEFWGGNIAMNLAFAGAGLRGSRSKVPYQAFQDLLSLGFSRKEANSLQNTITEQTKSGAAPHEIRATITDAIRIKALTAPESTQKKLRAASEGLATRLLLEEAAASGVRDHLINEAQISNFKKLANGNYSMTQLINGEDGKFESVDLELTEEELNTWLLERYDSDLTQAILDTQKLVRGESLATAAESLHSQGKSPFARIVSLADAPAELLANLKGKDTFDMETLSTFAQYAINEIDRRMASGQSQEQAEAADFGSTGTTLGTIARTAANFKERLTIAQRSHELKPNQTGESVALILPGKSTSDQILMLARGQVDAPSIAHDWMEGFARARYESDTSYWRDILDSLDRELLARAITRQSLFASPEGERSDLEYIEALSHLAQANWLTHHDSLNINATAHAVADELLEDLSAIQNGITFANELAAYLNSDQGKAAFGEKADAINTLFAKTTSALTDLIHEAEKTAPKSAAELVLQHRQRIQQELNELAAEADTIDSAAPATTLPQNDQLRNTHVPVDIPGAPSTLFELAQLNGINHSTGLLITPPPAAYTTVTSPTGAGRSLNGGIAHRMRDGSVIGTAPTSSLSLHPSLSHIDLTKAQGSTEEPVIAYRKKDGTLQVIGGFARLAADQQLGLANTEVRVYSQSSKLPHTWAADKAREHSIRAGLAHTRDIVKHLIKHKLTRTQARRKNLIPSDFLGQELPTSRAAWLLLKHAPAKTVASFSSGHLTTREAIADIADSIPTDDLLADAARTASFSLRSKKADTLFNKEGIAYTDNAIITRPGASFSIRALHASPANFRKFSTDFIGSGEGTQAFGWGLYFATRPGINKSYFRLFNRVIERWTPEYKAFNEEFKETGHDLSTSPSMVDNEDLVSYIEFFIEDVLGTKKITQKSLSAWQKDYPRLFEELRNEIKKELAKRPKGKFARFFFDYSNINKAIENYKKQLKNYNLSHSSYGLRLERMIRNKRQQEKIKKTKELSEKMEKLTQILEKLNKLKEKAKSIVMYEKVGTKGFNYRVELNADDSNLLMWDEHVPKDKAEAFVAANPQLRDYVKRNLLRSGIYGQEFYKYLWSGLTPDFDSTGEAQKAASMLLLKHGYKGIKFLDRPSRKKGEGTYNYVIFSGDDVKITEVNESGKWSMDEGWEEYTDPTASFAIRAKKAARKYMSLKEMNENEQFGLLLDEARRLENQSLSFLDPAADIDLALRYATRLNSLLNAATSFLPPDAQPWKTISPLRPRLATLAKAALNPHLNLSYTDARGLQPAEIDRFNNTPIPDRRDQIADKLAQAYKSLLKATARSLEAYLSRKYIDSVERAIKTLQPKLTPSGKERRGYTSAGVFTKAMEFYDMMGWTPLKQQEEEETQNNIITNPNSTQEQIDAAQTQLQIIGLFGGLRYANLRRTQEAVGYFMDFLSTGRAQWEEKLAQERLAAAYVQKDIADLQPTVDSAKVNRQSNERKPGQPNTIGEVLDSFMNICQSLHALSALPGKVGKYMDTLDKNISVAIDAKHHAVNAYNQKADAALDAVLGIQDKPATIRDIKRAKFLVECNQYPDEPITYREGTISITNFKITKEQLDALTDIQAKQGQEAFLDALRKRVTSANNKHYLDPQHTHILTEAYQDALAQSQEENYQGGDLYVKHYGPRDTEHAVELKLTRLQAANLVLTAEQPSYGNKYDNEGNLIERGTMDVNGYTDSVLRTLEHYAGKDLMTWLRQLREMFNTTGLFEAYEQHVGLPFPREENYWPGFFESPKQGQISDALDSAAKGTGLNQFLIKRRDHVSPPDPTMDALAVWRAAIDQHMSYIHLSPQTRELRRILRDNDTRTRLATLTTLQQTDNLVALLDTLDGAAAIALKAENSLNRASALAFGSRAWHILSGAITSAIKNATTVINGTAYDGINLLNIIPYIAKGYRHTQHFTPAQLAKLPTFQNRLHRDSLTTNAANLAPGTKQTALKTVGLWGMRIFMEYPDYAGNLLTMTAVANHKYDTLLADLKNIKGKNHTPTPEELADIRTQVEQEISRTVHIASQPLEKEDKAALLQQRNAATMATYFMRSETVVKVGLARSLYRRELAKATDPATTQSQKRLARLKGTWALLNVFGKVSCANQALVALISLATGSAPDDDEQFENWLISQIIAGVSGFGCVSLVPFVGDYLAMAGQAVFGRYGAFASFQDTGLGLSPHSIDNLKKTFTGKANTGEALLSLADLSRALGATIGTLGGTSQAATYANETLLAINTILNTTRPLFQRLKNTEKKTEKRRKKIQKIRETQNKALRKLIKTAQKNQ